MKDFFESIKEHVLQRFGNPFFGACAFAWLAWNHDYLIILFSSESDILLKLALAKAVAFPSWGAIIGYGVLLPFASAAVFILASPFPSRWASRWTLMQDRETKTMENELLGLIPLSPEAVEKIREDSRLQMEELRSENERLSAESARLRTENRNLLDERASREAKQSAITVAVDSAATALGLKADKLVRAESSEISKTPPSKRERAKGLEVEAEFEAVEQNLDVLQVIRHLVSRSEKSTVNGCLYSLRKIEGAAFRDQTYQLHLIDEAVRLGLVGREENPNHENRFEDRLWLERKGRSFVNLYGIRPIAPRPDSEPG